MIRCAVSLGKGSHRLNINLPDTAHCYRPITDQIYQWKAILLLLHTGLGSGVSMDLERSISLAEQRLTALCTLKTNYRDQVSQWKGPSHWLNNDFLHTARFQPITGSGVSMERFISLAEQRLTAHCTLPTNYRIRCINAKASHWVPGKKFICV